LPIKKAVFSRQELKVPMEEKLFDAFEPVNRQQWLDKITTDLKGKDYQSLHWQAAGLSGEPIFTREDLPEALPNLANVHPDPTVFGARHWVNYQWIKVNSEKEANAKALFALNNGATGIIFELAVEPDWKALLADIQLNYCYLGLVDSLGNANGLQSFEKYCQQTGINASELNGFAIQSSEATVLNPGPASFKYLNVSTTAELPVIELAGQLAVATNLFDELTDQAIAPSVLFSQTQFQLSLGSSYFAEIAKFRAMRSLAVRFASAYGLNLAVNEVQILGMSGDWSAQLDDPHSHMLHATTQAMAATIGGADAICIKPFYPVFKDEFLAERAARNISTILQEESYLAKVVDPAAGTYFIESLTDQMINQAWALFLAIEDAGGSHAIDQDALKSLHQKITA